MKQTQNPNWGGEEPKEEKEAKAKKKPPVEKVTDPVARAQIKAQLESLYAKKKACEDKMVKADRRKRDMELYGNEEGRSFQQRMHDQMTRVLHDVVL